MQSKSSGEAAYPISTLFKPRQVLLKSISNMKHEIENGTQTNIPISLTSQQRNLLLQSICQFLELNGFSKTLKNFCKEVNFEKESWKRCSLNLEEICYHYLKTRNDTKFSGSAIKEQAEESVNRTKENEGGEVKRTEATTDNHFVDVKKKKKKSKKSSDLSEEFVEGNPEDVSVSVPSEPEKKSKDKKKKHKDDSQEEKKDGFKVKLDELPAVKTSEKHDAESQGEKKEKSKNRKKKEDTFEPTEVDKEKKSSKKRKKSLSEENDIGYVENDLQVKSDKLPAEETSEKFDAASRGEKKDKSKSRKKKEDTVVPSEIDEEEKSSKKRKKSSSEVNDIECVENAAFNDSKRRKTENSGQLNGTILPKTPNGSANGLEKDEKQESQKNRKWQQDGSTEPRTSANAFRRVKEEEVEFVDEKLQDNSYWAKDGADSGYGAKAQEVLGQVRGRDFRHEKTKKKRGSYRGGQIDLHSHSFKFNYDDDE